MNLSPGAHLVRFGAFELDTRSGELRRHGLKIRLPEQSFQILRTLLMRPGDVVTREELKQVLWPAETFVDFEVGLNSAVRKLREALDDSAESPRFVETVPRRGYRFVAPLTSSVQGPPPAPPPEPAKAPAPPSVAEEQVVASDVASAPPIDPVAASAPIGRPSRVGRGRAMAIVVVVLVGMTGFAYKGGLLTPQGKPAVEQPIASIVVLPFENLTGDAGQDHLADSVTDAITAQLAQVEGLDVISRTSARQYKQTLKPLSQIRTELNNVEGVVEGTVQRSGDKVRITAKLIRTETDRTMPGSQIYEDEMSAIFSLHQQIASNLAVAAGRPRPSPVRARTIAPKATDAYVKGLTARGLGRHEGFRRAVGYFEEAIAIEPGFAEAYAELAQTQVQFLFGGPYSPHQVIPKAEAAARKALQLDNNLSKAHRALGQILNLYYWRWEEGDKELELASAIGGLDDPPEAVSASLRRRGLYQEAIAAAERGRKYDPLSVQAQIAVGSSYRAAGQYDRAMNEYRRALAMSPGNNRVNFQIGVNLVSMGRPADAIRDLQIAARQATGHNSRMEAYLGYAYAAAGRGRDAREVLKELEAHRKDQYVSWYGIALIHDALGEKALALAAFQRAFEDRAVEFGLHDHYSAEFRTIASEPAYQSAIRQVGR